MHRCEVTMRYKLDTPDDELLACGDYAIRKMGNLWICDVHYRMFRHPIEAGHVDGCEKATDTSDCGDCYGNYSEEELGIPYEEDDI